METVQVGPTDPVCLLEMPFKQVNVACSGLEFHDSVISFGVPNFEKSQPLVFTFSFSCFTGDCFVGCADL